MTMPNFSRPLGLSAFVRCKNEEEYIVASLVSIYRIFDEIVVILNNSTDQTREFVSALMTDRPRIKLIEYPNTCESIGHGYAERVGRNPEGSLARYYNWCLDQTNFSHVCKWDGDMIATPLFEQVRTLIANHDVVMFDGHDVIGEHTTDLEARIFRYDPTRARYLDWDLYEILQHDYTRIARLEHKCYLHMKLAKRTYLHGNYVNPNLTAVRSVPDQGSRDNLPRLWISQIGRLSKSIWARSLRTPKAGR
jgi:glycosyltransferase involved in cell wall biosynthesis